MTTFLQISIHDDGTVSATTDPDIVLSETLMDQLVHYLRYNTQLCRESTAEYLNRQVAEFSELRQQHGLPAPGTIPTITPGTIPAITPGTIPAITPGAIPVIASETISPIPADALDEPAEIIRDPALRNKLYFLHRAMITVDPQLRRRAVPYQGPNPQLANALQQWRREKARTVGLPAYIVLHQRVLFGIADAAPLTKAQLLAVSGFGPRLYTRYGTEILKLVARTLEEAQEEL